MKRTGLIALMMAVLSGCNAPMLGAPNRAAIPGKVGAQALSMDDADAVIFNRAYAAARSIKGGMPAILVAPTDTIAQRGLQTLYTDALKQVTPGIDALIDNSVADDYISQFKKEVPPVTDKPELMAYLQGIADRLSERGRVPKFKVHLVDVPEANAFNAGGTQMVIFTGLLASVKDEAELAGVMAHEMVHGLKRHMVKGSILGAVSGFAAQAVAEAQPVPDGEDKLVQAFLLSLPAQQRNDFDFMLGYLQGKVGQAAMTNFKFDVNSHFAQRTIGRSHEAESDTFGVRILSASGYDPYGMVRVFDRWNDYPNGDTRYYTHPDLGNRVASIRNQILEEGLAAGEKENGRERFKKAVSVLDPTQNGIANISPQIAKHLCWHRVDAFEPRALKPARAAQLTPPNRPGGTVSALQARR